MPLAPLPPSNTARLFVSYSAYGSYRHTVQLRPLTGFTIEDTREWFIDWLTANAALFATTTVFDEASVAVINSDVRNPVTWEEISGTGVAPADTVRDTRMISFPGRESSGRKSRLSFYGHVFGPDTDYRVLQGDSLVAAAAITGLNSLLARAAGMTGGKLSFKPYLNIRNNAYWQTAIRNS